MADWKTAIVTATCAHCTRSAPTPSCPVGENAGYHCLCAQGWFRSPAKPRNWSCPLCASEGNYWKKPDPSLLATDCQHRRLLPPTPPPAQAPPAQAAPPPPPAHAPRAAIEDILIEVETMGARLAELSLTLRDLLDRQQNAQRNHGLRPCRDPWGRLAEPDWHCQRAQHGIRTASASQPGIRIVPSMVFHPLHYSLRRWS